MVCWRSLNFLQSNLQVTSCELGRTSRERLQRRDEGGFQAQVITVLVASPGDTEGARDEIESAIHAWNRDRSFKEAVIVFPLRWESGSVPILGSSAQRQINHQLVDRADVVIAVFHGRLGSPTEAYRAGTVEEIERALSDGKRVHVFFSTQPLAEDVDLENLARLRRFHDSMQRRGLLGTFKTLEELREKVRSAIERDVDDKIDIAGAYHHVPPEVRFETRFEVVESTHRNRTTGEQKSNISAQLLLKNVGLVAAGRLVVEKADGVSSCDYFLIAWGDTLGPGETTKISVHPHLRRSGREVYPNVIHVSVRWYEEGRRYETVLEVQTGFEDEPDGSTPSLSLPEPFES